MTLAKLNLPELTGNEQKSIEGGNDYTDSIIEILKKGSNTGPTIPPPPDHEHSEIKL